MADVKVVELKISTNIPNATKQINDLKTGLKDTTVAAQGVNSKLGEMGGKSNVFDALKNGAQQLIPGLKGAESGMNGMILKMWEMVANPVGAVVAALVISLKFLYESFQSSVAGGKELKVAFAALSAVGAEIKEAMFGLGRALINVSTAAYKFITLDFKGAAEDMKKAGVEATNSQNQLADAVNGTTLKVIAALTRRQQANDKAAKMQEVEQAKTDKLLAKSRDILTDETASIAEKRKALEAVTKVESASAKEKLRIAQENLNIQLDTQKQYGTTTEMGKKMNQAIRDATIERDRAETENAQTGTKLNRQKKMLGRQEVADNKAANDEITASNKARYDADKLALETKLKEEGLSFQQRRDLIKSDTILTAKDKQKLLDEINKEELKTIADHKKAIEDLNKKYDDDAASRLAKTEQEKLDLEMTRKFNEIDNLTKTQAEKDILFEKWNQEYNDKQALLDENKKTKDALAQDAGFEMLIASNDTSISMKEAAIKAEQDLIDKQFEDKIITEEQFNAKTKMLADARNKIGDLEKQAKQNQLAGIGNALQQASAIAGESTSAGKALAVAATTISTYSSAQKAYESAFLPVPTVASPALGAVFAGVAVAGGLMNIQKILSVKTPKGGGGGSAPSMSSVPAPPSFNVVGTSGVNQIAGAIGTMNQEPVKAYVVSGDMTSQQSVDRNIRTNASFGG